MWELSLDLDQEAIKAAERSFDKLLLEARTNDILRDALRAALSESSFAEDEDPEAEIQELSALAAIQHELAARGFPITPSMVRTLENLVAREAPERRYQSFFAQNPVFLDPIAAEVIPEKPLGLEFKTDFVVRRHDYEYLVVEIEKPQDPVFTKKGDFSAQFFHAFGQVLEFQAWVEENAAYAREHMPGITSPRGLLVIGREPSDPRLASKLRRFQVNSPLVDVLTYDRILERARNLYRSLYGQSID